MFIQDKEKVGTFIMCSLEQSRVASLWSSFLDRCCLPFMDEQEPLVFSLTAILKVESTASPNGQLLWEKNYVVLHADEQDWQDVNQNQNQILHVIHFTQVASFNYHAIVKTSINKVNNNKLRPDCQMMDEHSTADKHASDANQVSLLDCISQPNPFCSDTHCCSCLAS